MKSDHMILILCIILGGVLTLEGDKHEDLSIYTYLSILNNNKMIEIINDFRTKSTWHIVCWRNQHLQYPLSFNPRFCVWDFLYLFILLLVIEQL